jgi:hypothetical protein
MRCPQHLTGLSAISIIMQAVIIRPKIKNCLFSLYLATDLTKCPYSTHFICQFQINFFSFCKKKSKLCPNLLHLHTHFVKYIFCFYLPTRYPPGPVGKGETNTFLSWPNNARSWVRDGGDGGEPFMWWSRSRPGRHTHSTISSLLIYHGFVVSCCRVVVVR